MPGDIDHVIRAPQDVKVAVLVAHTPVKGGIHQLAGYALPIGFDETFIVTPQGLQTTGRQRAFDHDHAFFLRTGQFFAGVVVQQLDVKAVHGHAGAAEFAGHGLHAIGHGQYGPAGFGLPVVVDDGFAQTVGNPLGGRFVQRLARQIKRLEAGDIVFGQQRWVLLFQDTHRRGGAEHVRDLVFLNQLPPDTAVRTRRQAFVHQCRHASDQRAVNDVAVAHHPADIAGAEIHLTRLTLKNMLHAGGQGHGVTGGVALHAFGFAGGA